MLHSIKYYLTCNIVPRSCDNSSISIMLLDHIYSCNNLLFCSILCTAENYSSTSLDLIQEELTNVLDIHFSLSNINYSCCPIKRYLYIFSSLLDSFDNITQLTDS